MYINRNTMQALQIMEDDKHPSMHSNSSKEGFTLFGKQTCHYIPSSLLIGLLSNMCQTSSGKKLMKSMFMKPLQSIDEIKQRFDFISFFMLPENTSSIECLQKCLRHITNIQVIRHNNF